MSRNVVARLDDMRLVASLLWRELVQTGRGYAHKSAGCDAVNCRRFQQTTKQNPQHPVIPAKAGIQAIVAI